MKIIDIQKNLLISHLGLSGLNEELLETFPVQSLVEKADDNVCVSFNIDIMKKDLKLLLKVIDKASKVLEINPESVERKNELSNAIVIDVFYDSKEMHWSDRAALKFEALFSALNEFEVKINAKASINN